MILPLYSSLAYAAIFRFPLKKKEILFWWPEKRASLLRVKAFLKRAQKKGVLEEKDGYYFPSGCSSWVKERRKRKVISYKKYLQAQKEAQFLIKMPGVAMVGLSGSVAVGNARSRDDIDLLIITLPGKLWTGRFFSVFSLAAKGRRRWPEQKKVRDKFCLNLFLDANYLSLANHDIYTAHEILQMVPLADRGRFYNSFLKANRWVERFFPLAYQKRLALSRRNKVFSHSLLIDLGGEKFYRFLQLAYMRLRRRQPPSFSGQLFFHPSDERKKVIALYQANLKYLLTKEKGSL